MGLTRRSFLGLGAAGTALLAFGGVGIGLMPSTLAEPAKPLTCLTEQEYSVLKALARVICPATGSYPSTDEVHVAEKLDQLFATFHPGMQTELKQAILVFENALVGMVFDQRLTTFTGASVEAQAEIVEAWRTSNLGVRSQIYTALRGLIAGAYFGSPETYAAVGYPGPPDYKSVAAQAPADPAPEPATEATP